jgi:perosamine synthetase
MSINLSSPDINQSDIDAVVAVLKTPTLSLGPKLPEFEQAMARYVGVKHAVALNSGTSALDCALRGRGIAAGDEVITTPFSFIASSNCILFQGARPVFVDMDPATYNIDVSKIEAAITPRTRALLPVDVFGSMADMDAVNDIARRHNLFVVEDSCEALGSTYKGRPAGSLGHCGAFAFYPNKQMTTGEGGMLVTNDDHLAAMARSLRNQGRGEGSAWLAHERLGYNFRLPDILCALGISQLARLDQFVALREAVAARYNALLADVPEVTVPPPNPFGRMSWFVYVIRLADRFSREDRDAVMQGLRQRGIGCNNYFSPIHLQPFYQQGLGTRRGDFPVTERIADRTIALPFYNHLPESDQRTVVNALKEILAGLC